MRYTRAAERQHGLLVQDKRAATVPGFMKRRRRRRRTNGRLHSCFFHDGAGRSFTRAGLLSVPRIQNPDGGVPSGENNIIGWRNAATLLGSESNWRRSEKGVDGRIRRYVYICVLVLTLMVYACLQYVFWLWHWRRNVVSISC